MPLVRWPEPEPEPGPEPVVAAGVGAGAGAEPAVAARGVPGALVFSRVGQSPRSLKSDACRAGRGATVTHAVTGGEQGRDMDRHGRPETDGWRPAQLAPGRRCRHRQTQLTTLTAPTPRPPPPGPLP